MPPLDTGDFEICPPGTMDAMTSAANELEHLLKYHGPIKGATIEAALVPCRAILKAHRERMGVEPTDKESLTVAKPEEWPFNDPKAMASLERGIAQVKASQPQPDYTSETEDLTTWPQTRGKEWRRMEKWEVMQKGDAFCNHPDQMGFYVDGFIGSLASSVAGEYAQVWTRRPPPTGEG